MTSRCTDCGWVKSKKVEDKMFDMLYNSLLNFEKRIEIGLACGVEDVNLGIEKKVKPYMQIPISEEIKKFEENISPIKLRRNIL